MGKGNQKNLVKKKKQNVFRALFRRIDALTASITLLVKDKLRPAAAPAAPPAEPLRVSRSRSESMSSCFGAPSRRIGNLRLAYPAQTLPVSGRGGILPIYHGKATRRLGWLGMECSPRSNAPCITTTVLNMHRLLAETSATRIPC